MRRSLMEFIEAVQKTSDVDSLETVIVDWGRRLGFRLIAFTSLTTMEGGGPPLFLGSFPEAWMSRYREQGYVSVDPIVRRGLQSVLPFSWETATDQVSLVAANAKVIEEAAEFGLCRGFSVPVHGPEDRFSLLTAASDDLDHGFGRLVELSGDSLQIGAVYLHNRVGQILGARNEGQAPPLPQLSQRERECLHWTSCGKTAAEIATILGIAEATVIYHFENSKKKLNARSKAHAVAKALALGLLGSR